MISWLIIIILAYVFFGLSSFGDKLVLSGRAKPKLYTFYVGSLNLLILLLIPFADFAVPAATDFFWIILSSLVFIVGLYVLYLAVATFDVSKVAVIVGAVQPVFILLLGWIFWGFEAAPLNHWLAFLMLLTATIIISFEKRFSVNKKLLTLSLTASFLVALNFVSMKMVFLSQPFLRGFIWVGIFNFLFVLCFFFDQSFRKEIFTKKQAFDRKTLFLVIATQGAGGLAGFLQNFAISLASASNLPILNALRGIQYVFLFFISLFFSQFFPNIFKEGISKKIIIQKALAIVLIVAGLAILVLK